MLESVAAPNELTARQQEAVEFRGANLLLEAVPGSGKTRVIAARCAALIAEGVPGAEILVLTFSRRAVLELRARIAGALPGPAAPDIHTFHGFAARLLAETGTAGHSRRLLSEPAERALFEYAVGSCALPSLPPAITRSALFRDAAAVRISELRRSTPADLAKLAARATPRLADLLELANQTTLLRERLGAADYDDLVARAVRLASVPGGAAATRLNGRYAHVLVDEFQDTDPVQLALLETLHAEIFAVGDAAQAIYGFRGAARNALQHACITLAMKTLPLDESFRCPAAVCALAASVWPAAPLLQARVERPGRIEFRRAASPPDEAAYVGEAVAAALAAGTSEREIAVLMRTAEPLARLIERELSERGIRVARQAGDNVLDDLAVDAICTMLRAFAHTGDADRWLQLFGHPVFGVEPLTLRLALGADQPRNLEAACALIERIDAPTRVPLKSLAKALRSAHAFWQADEPARAARAFAAESNILGYVVARDESDIGRSAKRIVDFLDALGDVHDVRARLGLDTSSAAVVEAFLRASEAWSAGMEAVDDAPGVRVLTIHAAKGLEFDFVVVADAVDDRFPQARRTDALLGAGERELARHCGVELGTRADEALAEERSLWYVAVTRSKDAVLVTWSETGLDASPQRPSRFIPLGERLRETRRPSFRGPLTFVPALSALAPQLPVAARLGRPLRTSTIEKWLRCRRQFYYDALLRIGKDERGFKAKLGTLVHASIARFHATVRDFRAVEAGMHVTWTQALHAHARAILDSDPDHPFDSKLERAAALRAADRLLERYARQLETAARERDGGFEVTACEEPVSYTVAGVALSGKIDRIDRQADGTLELVDVKTGAFKGEKAMATAFPKLAAIAAAGDLWIKPTPPANPQLALYRHAKSDTRGLSFWYLDARPKFGEFIDAAQLDRLDVERQPAAIDALDDVLRTIFFEPWTTGTVVQAEPTHIARVCRHCEFVTVCPGYLEDDD